MIPANTTPAALALCAVCSDTGKDAANCGCACPTGRKVAAYWRAIEREAGQSDEDERNDPVRRQRGPFAPRHLADGRDEREHDFAIEDCDGGGLKEPWL